jgi:hypothetical protein
MAAPAAVWAIHGTATGLAALPAEHRTPIGDIDAAVRVLRELPAALRR